MTDPINVYEYLINLFTYALNSNHVHKNTLFRFIYIYRVTVDYLFNSTSELDNDVYLDYSIGVSDYSSMEKAFGQAIANNYIKLGRDGIEPENKLNAHIAALKEKSDKVRTDLQNIAYLSSIVSTYSEDVILSIFFNEPNVKDAYQRNSSNYSLRVNKLKELLSAFEKKANEQRIGDVDKADVFIRWMDYITENYLKEKEL